MDNIIAQKRCTKCGEIKSLDCFSKNSGAKDGKLSYCRICNRTRVLRWQKENKELVNKKIREWSKKNPDKRRIYYRRWLINNKEVARMLSKKWGDAHREKRRASVMSWQKSHPEKRRINEQNRRCLKNNNGGAVTEMEWKDLKIKYGNKCLSCGRTDTKLTMDHVNPLSLGGKHEIENIQCLCGSCNSKKGTKHIDYRPFR